MPHGEPLEGLILSLSKDEAVLTALACAPPRLVLRQAQDEALKLTPMTNLAPYLGR